MRIGRGEGGEGKIEGRKVRRGRRRKRKE